MIRKLVLVMASTAVVALAAPPALAGGGCHDGGTVGGGETVEIVDACFTPTILRVAPGETVTFVNTDPFVHNVTANGWGHFDDLAEGDRFHVTFDDAGTYPFACTYHPGMSGAIVVGDGTGTAGSVIVSSAASPAPSVEPESSAVRTVGDGPGTIAALLGGIAIGIALGMLGTRSLGRRREAASTVQTSTS